MINLFSKESQETLATLEGGIAAVAPTYLILKNLRGKTLRNFAST